MKISDHFSLEEFVPQGIFNQYGQKAQWFVDPRLITLAEAVRLFFAKPVTINNWHTGGQFNYRGFRDPDCTVGAKLSQHRMGRAIDINVAGMTPQEVYKAILGASAYFMGKGLTTMEDIASTPTWCHLYIRQTNQSSILIVEPQ